MTKRTTEELKQAILAAREFDGDDAGEDLLESTMRARNTEIECLAIIKEEGWLVKGDRGQSKAHPLAATARDARAQYFQGLKLLGLLETEGVAKPVGSPSAYDRWNKPKAGKGRVGTKTVPVSNFKGLVD